MKLINCEDQVPQGIDKAAEPSRFLKQLATLLSEAAEALDAVQPALGEEVDFYQEVRRFEIALIERALRKARGNQAKAARLLQLKQTTLHGKIKQYAIHPPFLGYCPEEPTSRSEQLADVYQLPDKAAG